MGGTRETIVLEVEGMSCQGCANAVRKTVQRLDALAEVVVDLAAKRVTAATSADGAAVAAALNAAGYPASAAQG
jgi:copper chaperone